MFKPSKFVLLAIWIVMVTAIAIPGAAQQVAPQTAQQVAPQTAQPQTAQPQTAQEETAQEEKGKGLKANKPARDRSQSQSSPTPLPVDAPKRSEVDEAVRRGKEFLLSIQNKNGSWGAATNTKDLNIYAPVPGAHHAFRSAVTAMCVSALIDLQVEDTEVSSAIDRGETWLLEHLKSLRRANQDALYNVWGHAYGIEALVRLHCRHASNPEQQGRLMEEIVHQIELLGRYESVHGGWGYYDFSYHLQKPTSQPNSFTTATVLFAFYQAQQIGAVVPQRLIDRGLDVIRRQQRPDLAYLYSEDFRTNPSSDINKPGGSVGRSQACNVVLRMYKDPSVSDEAMVAWTNRLFSRNLWLDIGRKRPIPHESWFLVAGYFFYYGHYYAAYGIEHIPAAQQTPARQQLLHVMLKLQEKDGSWWDYPLYDYHRPYGTAFALMAIKRCESAAE